MDTPTFQVRITEGLKEYINEFDLPYNEVVEISEIEDEILFILSAIGF